MKSLTQIEKEFEFIQLIFIIMTILLFSNMLLALKTGVKIILIASGVTWCMWLGFYFYAYVTRARQIRSYKQQHQPQSEKYIKNKIMWKMLYSLDYQWRNRDDQPSVN